MNLKTEKQKVKKWNRETELWGHNGKRSNTHATDRVLSAGPDEMAFPVLLFCGCLAFFCLFLCKKRSNKEQGWEEEGWQETSGLRVGFRGRC